MSKVPSSSSVSGRLALYRVLKLSQGFVDRGDDSKSYRPEPTEHGSVEITVGALPESLVIDLRYAVPVMSALPAARAAMAHPNIDEPEDDGQPYDLSPPDFVDPADTYLTVCCASDAELTPIPDRTAFWVADCESALAMLAEHRDLAEPVIDRLCARLLGQNIQSSKVVRNAGPFFEPRDDHQPLVITTIEMSATARSDKAGWADYDISALAHLADTAWTTNPEDGIVLNPAWWYYQAMNEKDPLRRFLFAHWGLEALATQFCKQYQNAITASLASKHGLPAASLFWPTPEGSDRPWRSIEFQFALMAYALRGSDSEKDVTEFKRLAALRNKVSHGKRIDHKTLPMHDGFRMLQTYIRLAANYTGHEATD